MRHVAAAALMVLAAACQSEPTPIEPLPAASATPQAIPDADGHGDAVAAALEAMRAADDTCRTAPLGAVADDVTSTLGLASDEEPVGHVSGAIVGSTATLTCRAGAWTTAGVDGTQRTYEGVLVSVSNDPGFPGVDGDPVTLAGVGGTATVSAAADAGTFAVSTMYAPPAGASDTWTVATHRDGRVSVTVASRHPAVDADRTVAWLAAVIDGMAKSG